MRKLNADRLDGASQLLGETVLDPAMWPQAMDAICGAVFATGAALLQSDARSPDIPRTPAVDAAFRNYFRDQWHLRDVRAERGAPLLLAGQPVIIDQDLFTACELRRNHFYNEALLPFGIQWFAAVGLFAGSAPWVLAFQRAPREGPFSVRDKKLLATLSSRLTEVASLSTAVGRAVISGSTNALNEVRQAAVAIDRVGRVLDTNQAADALFCSQIGVKNARIVVADRAGQATLTRLLDQLRITPDTGPLASPNPIVIRREGRSPVVIRALPVHGAARTPFLGARALLTFTPIETSSRPRLDLLSTAFGLTAAEAKLASVLAGGIDLERAAEQLGIARATARNQLKAVFAKTDTHRQSELVALVAKL